MPVEPTSIPGLVAITWDTYGDERGFFRQTWQHSELEAALGREVRFVQGNHARSQTGVLRGFHAEPWDKLVYVVRGLVFSAIADLRPDSPTFGRVETSLLGDSPGERSRLFLPAGVGNAYCVVTGPADYCYEVTAEFTSAVDKRAVAWDDPDLDVDWPVDDPILSSADESNPTLRERYPDHPVLAELR